VSEQEAREVAYRALEFFPSIVPTGDGHYHFNVTRDVGVARGLVGKLEQYLNDVLAGEWRVILHDEYYLCDPAEKRLHPGQKFVKQARNL
jgi:hypothetical protein